MAEHSPGPALRAERTRHGRSLRSFATELGVSPATLSALERGLTPITVDRLERAAALLGTTASALLSAPVALAVPTPDRVAISAHSVPRHWRNFDDIAMDPILEAAIRHFVRHGFHATTMREIAAEAGLSVAGVYHHHPSKEHILVAILDITIDEITWRLQAAKVEGRDPVESFAHMVESLALFHAVRGDIAFIGASEMRALSSVERVRITAMRDDVQHALDRQAQHCVDAGHFYVDDLHTATRAIATMCTSLPSWFRLDGQLTPGAVAASYSAFALSMLGGA
jgi:AcrR family transcriptional regulator